MPEIITCPQCQRRLVLPDNLAGQAIQCPACQARFEGTPALDAIPVDAIPSVLPAEREAWIDWASPPAEPPARSARRLPRTPWPVKVGVALALLLALMVLGSLSWRALPPRPAPAWEDAEERRREVAAAFANEPPLVDGEVAEPVQKLLLSLGDALKAADAGRVTAHFDIDRMYDELTAQGLFPNRPPWANRGGVVRGMRQGLGQALVKQAPLMQWDRVEVRNVKLLGGNEAVVIARLRGADALSLKMRWWVRRQGGEWKIYDLEDLDMGMRFSVGAASIAGMGLGLGEVQEMSRAVNHLRDALMAIALQQDPDTAEKKLKLAERVHLPPPLEPVRQLIIALVHMARGEDEEALKVFTAMQRLNPDMPCLDLFQGMACNRLGRWADGVRHLQAYRALLGDDPLLCYELGEALRGVSRFPDAQEAYRKCLDEEPENLEAYQGLLFSLAAGDNHTDLGPRFLKLGQHKINFSVLAEDCRDRHDGQALEEIARAMRQLDPQHGPADFNLALAKAYQGQLDQAMPFFQSALRKEPDNRKAYLKEFAEELARDGQALDAYARLPDPRETFAVLADQLRFRPDELAQLLAAHRQQFANDPLLPFYQGELHVRRSEYELADQAFQAGMKRPPHANLLEEFRRSRVTARFYAGHGLEAYATIGPADETFKQLAGMAYYQDDLPLLEKLLAAHARQHPDDLELLRYRCRLAIKQRRPAEAVQLFQAVLPKLPDDEDDRDDFLFDFLNDMARAGLALVAYRAAPDPLEAFRSLAGELDSEGRYQDLNRLIALHRQMHPRDSWVFYHLGQEQLHRRNWAAAAELFRQGLRLNDEDAPYGLRADFVVAMHRLGQGLQAYREAGGGDRPLTFNQLAEIFGREKRQDDLVALIAAHQNHGADTADLTYANARLAMLRQRADQAVQLYQQARNQSDDPELLDHRFVRDMAEAGFALEAYRGVADRVDAFATLARNLLQRQQVILLESLLDEHARDHAGEPLLRLYRGELHLLQGDPKLAEKEFAAGLAQHKDHITLRDALFRARIRQGRTVATAREFKDQFGRLAQLCSEEKNLAELQALLVDRRQAEPADPDLLTWDLEVLWLNKDYAGVIRSLSDNQKAFELPRHRWKRNHCLIRALVKLQRLPEAAKEADRIAETRNGDLCLVVLAHAAGGDPAQTIAAMQRLGPPRWLVARCYRDEDLGPILKSDRFADFRQAYPEPEPEPELDWED